MTNSKVNFLIGTASAAVQIEGSLPYTNWHKWADTPGKIADGSSPEPATDHWNRWREDNALMQELNLQIARISIDWARIEPKPGNFDLTALERYREEIIDLKERGIRPLVTLHHFGHPQWFDDLGGFTKLENVSLFLRFISQVLKHLGDLVDDWITVNEPNILATNSHLYGVFPTGEKSFRKLFAMLRCFAVAHIRAYKLIHQKLDRPGRKIQVSFAHAIRAFDPLNPRNPLHRFSAKVTEFLFQRIIEDACFTGKFHPLLGIRPKDLQAGKYCDVIAVNYYTRSASGFLSDGVFPGTPVTDLGWEIFPQGLTDVVGELYHRHHLPIWVTENGCADNGDGIDPASERFRRKYLHDHFMQMIKSGLPFERYYHWCFVDNWEWAEGMIPHFGIVGMEPGTLNRKVKESAKMLRDIINAGEINDDIRERYL
ncbi:MAG: family 1 glycosylhydrolase [Arcanobacterium sp.]|nr:family 1 glycosylhydrolase [Arcanobacterium sp.]